jgi:uncharacterized repeat protein (TIGR04052 family)
VHELLRPLVLATPVTLLAACGPSTPSGASVALGFVARVGGEPFVCGRTYPGVGTSDTAITVQDLRFYVHDVRFVTADGREIPLALDQDDFQNGTVALLDFETGGSGCGAGNAPTHTELSGSLAEAGPFTALRLRIGVPEARNHLDSGGQPSPLNLSTMYWGWQGGYKYLRFEALTDAPAGAVSFHLGATGCSGDATMGTRTCANGNRPALELALPPGFSPATHQLVVDVAAWLAEMDLRGDGCESAASDPECPAWNATVGLPDASAQTFLRVEARPSG